MRSFVQNKLSIPTNPYASQYIHTCHVCATAFLLYIGMSNYISFNVYICYPPVYLNFNYRYLGREGGGQQKAHGNACSRGPCRLIKTLF